MPTPRRIRPHVHRSELTAALDRIAERHARADDEIFARIDSENPADVLGFLVKNLHLLPPDIKEADVRDALILNGWMWWEDVRREHALLVAGVAAGVPLGELGARLGVTDEGVQNRIDRGTALLRFDRPDASLAREARRTERDQADRSAAACTWIGEHEEWVAATAARLVSYGSLCDEEAGEWMEEVARDWKDRTFTPTTLTLMGLAAAALRVSPDVLNQPPQHAVHRAIRHVHDLRTQFARLA
jgi:hypothetical protein